MSGPIRLAIDGASQPSHEGAPYHLRINLRSGGTIFGAFAQYWAAEHVALIEVEIPPKYISSDPTTKRLYVAEAAVETVEVVW